MVFKKGNIPWIKGRYHTEETKKKLSNITKKLWKNLKYRKKTSNAHKGQKIRLGMKHTKETKKKLSKLLKKYYKTHKHPMEGKHHLKKSREKISKSRTGFKHSEKTKKKMSLAQKGKPKLSLRGRKYTKEQIRNFLRRRTLSSLEQKMIEIIQKLQLPYKFVGNGKFFIENKNPDFINCNGEKIAIEVFYRRHKEQFRKGLQEWMEDRQKIFTKYGWQLLFFDETQVNEDFIKNRLR